MRLFSSRSFSRLGSTAASYYRSIALVSDIQISYRGNFFSASAMWSSIGACRIDLRAMINALDDSSQRLEKAPRGKRQSGAVADIHRCGGIVRFVPIRLCGLPIMQVGGQANSKLSSRFPSATMIIAARRR
jgi:hypothetical protein